MSSEGGFQPIGMSPPLLSPSVRVPPSSLLPQRAGAGSSVSSPIYHSRDGSPIVHRHPSPGPGGMGRYPGSPSLGAASPGMGRHQPVAMPGSPSMRPFTRLPVDAEQMSHQPRGAVDNWSQQQLSSPKSVNPWPTAESGQPGDRPSTIYNSTNSAVGISGGSTQAPTWNPLKSHMASSPARIASPYVSPMRTGSPYISPARSATSFRNLVTSQTLGDDSIMDELEFTHTELNRVMAGNAEVTEVAHRALAEKNLAVSMLAKVTAEKHELEPVEANYAIEVKLNKKLQGMVEQLEEKQAVLSKENASLKEQLSLTRELNGELMLGLDEAKGTNASQFEGLSLAKADFEARVGALSLRLETALLDRKQLKQKLDAMEKETAPIGKLSKEAEFEVVSILEEKAMLNKFVVDLEKRLVAKSESLNGMERERDDALLAANELRTELRTFKRGCEDLEALLQKVIIDRDIYFARGEQAERELKDWRRKESIYKDQTAERNALRKNLTLAEERVKELDIKLSEVQERSMTDLHATTRRAEWAEKELKKLKEEASQVMSDKNRLKAALEEVENAFENSKKIEGALRSEISAANEANIHLRRSLATTVSERDGLGAKVFMLDGLMAKKGATSRAVVERVVLRWKHVTLSAAWDGWRGQLEHALAVKARILFRWSNLGLQKSFIRWRDCASGAAQARSILDSVVYRWTHQTLATAVNTWRDKKNEQARNKNVVAKVVYRWSHKTLNHAMGSWKEAIVEMSRQRSIIGRLLFRWQNKCLVSAINSWAMQVERQRELADKTQRVLYRWVNQRIVSAFNHWVERTEALKQLKNRVGATLFRWHNQSLATAFNAWAFNVDELKLHRAIMGRVLDRWTQQMILNAFNTWSDSTSRHQRETYVINKVLKRWTSMTMLRAFNAWLESMTQEGRMQANGKAMAAVLHLWQKRSSQATLAITAWKMVLHRSRVLSNSFNRLASRSSRYLVSRAFSWWYGLCQEAKARARAVALRWNRLLIGATLSSIQVQMAGLGEEFSGQQGNDTPPSASPMATGGSPMSAAIADPRNRGKILTMMGSSGKDIVVRIPTKPLS